MKQTLIFLFVVVVSLFSCKNDVEKTESSSEKNLTCNWKVMPSDYINDMDSIISKDGYDDTTWKEANIPSTVFNVLEQNGYYHDIYKGTQLEHVDKKLFSSPWWFRNTFKVLDVNKYITLKIDGVNHYADIWINGNKIADSSVIKNPFRQFTLPLNKYIKKGKNSISLKIYPPKKGDYNIGFVDWNPMAPDQEMGITRPIRILTTDEVVIDQPYIQSVFKNDNYQSVDLVVSAVLKNMSGNEIKGVVHFKIDDLLIKKEVTLSPLEERKISLSSKEFKELTIQNPKLWWPHTYGAPNLYHADISFNIKDMESDRKRISFGIREVSDYFTEAGHRGFKINGEKILIRGGGWVDNLTLNNTEENIKAQLEYVKDMNLNTIRLEGFWGNSQKMYDLCDQMGILIMVGWSCHWEWEEYVGKECHDEYGAITSDQDIDLIADAWEDQIIWLRNHPSIFTWMAGSDKIPTPKLEKKYFDIFKKYDTTRVYLSSAKDYNSLAGPSGVKMRGPYEVVPPIYWYQDTIHGGAFGFNTETGPGAQVPPLESIKKMIPEQHLWPIDSVWDYHCGRNEFNNLKKYNEALFGRYGTMNSVEEYAFKAQAMNYELMRAMFEAFSIRRYEATGVIQWMLNSAWPEMYWQLYDYYLMPNGAYYGAKKASKAIHAAYDYAENSVFIVNDKLENIEDLEIEVKVYNAQAKSLFDKTIKIKVNRNSSLKVLDLPEINVKGMYFLSLKVRDRHKVVIDDNFYWLSNKKDMLDYKATDWYYTPFKKYADFKDLNTMESVAITHEMTITEDDDYTVYSVNLENPSDKIAFLINVKLSDKTTGEQILPVLWSDNYISLLPNEKRTLVARIHKKFVKGKNIEISTQTWNGKNKND